MSDEARAKVESGEAWTEFCELLKKAGEGPQRTMTVSGIARFGSVDSIGGATFAVFDVPTAQKLLTALDLFEAGVTIMRESLRRRHHDADEDQIDELLGEWLRQRPGAQHGDARGRRTHWPRRTGEP